MKSFVGYVEAMEVHKPYIAMLFVQCVYSGMALFSKAAISQGMNPPIFVFYRQAFATVAMAPLAFLFERKKAVPLCFKFLSKVFLVSLVGITLSLNLYYIAINHTSATFAAATTNTIPAITLLLALLFRYESICIRKVEGMAKLMGAMIGFSGALVFAFVKGPPMKFMNWYPQTNNNNNNNNSNSNSFQPYSTLEWIKGSFTMLSANIAWSLWLVLQVLFLFYPSLSIFFTGFFHFFFFEEIKFCSLKGFIVKEYPAKLRITTLQCFFSLIQSALWAVVMERKPQAWKLGWNLQLFSVAYCGVIVTGMTYWLQIWCVEKKGPVFTAMFTPLALIITAIFSALLWKESLHWGSVGGAILLVMGLYFVLWGKKKEDGKIETIEQRHDTKEETILECITTHH
ncbi:WAT1-related protein At1g43650 isoform X1 [Benincasa hispida]|uniref:WAT1-related protein At1g43650 isoform X1 n=1 Tax=Benincasa hispida TaxID=102211 RepID=UPI00190093A1|nr:WAT1-related protein At1g43650 isoform X1 [Benincasa hispida]